MAYDRLSRPRIKIGTGKRTREQRIADGAFQALQALPAEHPSRVRSAGGGKSEWAKAYGYLTACRAASRGSHTHFPNADEEEPPALALQLLREATAGITHQALRDTHEDREDEYIAGCAEA